MVKICFFAVLVIYIYKYLQHHIIEYCFVCVAVNFFYFHSTIIFQFTINIRQLNQAEKLCTEFVKIYAKLFVIANVNNLV